MVRFPAKSVSRRACTRGLYHRTPSGIMGAETFVGGFLFGAFILVSATLVHLYVFWRASSVPAVRRFVPRRVLGGTGAFLWAGFTAARVLGHGGSGGTAAMLE